MGVMNQHTQMDIMIPIDILKNIITVGGEELAEVAIMAALVITED